MLDSELTTLELDTVNPDCLIWISNVDTFNFLLNPHFFSLFGYLSFVWPMRVHSLNFKFLGFSDWVFRFLQTPLQIGGVLQTQDYIYLKINKKRRSCIDFDIHNSKVFSSNHLILIFTLIWWLKNNWLLASNFQFFNILKVNQGLENKSLRQYIEDYFLYKLNTTFYINFDF